jgi:hypothetical protein
MPRRIGRVGAEIRAVGRDGDEADDVEAAFGDERREVGRRVLQIRDHGIRGNVG